ncbi:MAG: PQQ-binding-like beta-propeller repeat protein [Acidobacteria bacterium]|nr:PQQ-binding-like beta-propeller repeat protein [Acidobacteriota bacterium]NIQ30684.1 PQQ-binding-like beta-propeller repeat protein [Acidobacteriota bacterium]
MSSVEGVHQAHLLVQSDNSLLLVWVQKGPDDLDLFAARRVSNGKFSNPIKINRQGLNRYTGDEARPSVALGPKGTVAIAWTARNNDIVLATGHRFGTAFDPPIKLNQDEGKAYRTMPATAISPDGATHTVWLDPRDAPPGREEPSDLYYARVEEGAVEEKNLTAMQELTVCGCCRPYLAIEGDGTFDIAFRNSTEGGYRDISVITGRAGKFGEPRATSPPIWKLGGCPMAGPIRSDGGTMWKDASTGSWRLLWSTDAGEDPKVLLEDGEGLVLGNSPRYVSGRDGWVLIAAEPHSFILAKNGDSWKVESDDLPAWVSSAAVVDDRLVLIGTEDGGFRAETRRP